MRRRAAHLRAADWYEANGSPVLAVQHLLDTTERDRSIQLVTVEGSTIIGLLGG